MVAGTNFSNDDEENAVLTGIRIAIQHASEPTFVVNDLGQILLANEAAVKLTHPHAPETLGAIGTTEHSDHDTLLERAIRRSGPSHMRLKLASGQSFVFYIRRLDFDWKGGRTLALVQADQTKTMVSKFIEVQSVAETARDRLRQSLAEQADLRREAQQLRRLASTDQLTGLLNSATFAQMTGDALLLADGAQGVLLYLDLNGFKAVNDRFGHAVGDAVLCCTAQRLRAELRQNDLIARLGGDEFGIWLAGVSEEVCERIVARLEQALSEPIRLTVPQAPEQIDNISVALGRARWPEDGADVKALLQTADSRMYAAKKRRAKLEQITLAAEAPPTRLI
ncbi:sensor domain-containing diguanylate cyclase [Puniceibacterium sediminis]|uniref:Diguanylate cyclase (GGDEF) domain-containing protein n=1 Tax=Puniceibacterium sediminis TaxID=1608407 RepID=A0A238UW06_9RHOB|nr:diguanylate cyclase [Puniceibacterium sediminis]SNR26186.1 diguanylate cyclase (GGDEF) domain-containing protein [Puniceibacterium sediminis]